MQKRKLTILSIIIFILAGLGIFYAQQRITVSVIIPVYNAEKYLPQSLDSVFAQSGSYEVIAINDGSTDNSLQILESYAKKHSNMVIINQENKGVAAARNAGLKVAKNKYITFVDSDDWLERNAFENVLPIIKKDKSDVVLTGIYDVYDKEWVKHNRGIKAAETVAEVSRFPMRKLDKLSLFSPFYGNDAYSDLFYVGTGIRGQFFKNNFIKEHKIEFPLGTKCGEDDVFLFRSFLHNPLISVLPTPIYNYRNRVDSLAKSKSILVENRNTLKVLQETPEYQKASRRVQMFINDAWLAWIFIGISNLQRHGAPWGAGAVEAYAAYKTFDSYNKVELKACRNYPKVRYFLEEVNFNQAL